MEENETLTIGKNLFENFHKLIEYFLDDHLANEQKKLMNLALALCKRLDLYVQGDFDGIN